MKILKSICATLAVSLLLIGCGGGNTLTGNPGSSSSGGSSGGTNPTPTAITATSNSASILADGSNTAKITVIAVDANNVLLANVPITMAASSGALSVSSAVTDATGSVTGNLNTGGDPTVRTITVTATSGTLTSSAPVQVIANGSSSPVASLTVTTDTPTILSDGSTTANITALARDASNNLVPNVPVTFSATSGGIAAINSTTDASGAAKAVLSTAGDTTLRTITVTAKVNALTATVPVQVVAGTGTVNVQMGSGTGVNFTPGTIAVSSPTLSAGGSTSLQVVLQQSDGTLYTQSATISFSSVCAAQNLASLTPSVTTTTGIAVATYSASGCSGADTITATSTIGAHSLSASATVTVAPASIGSIRFVSATPTLIALQGLGSASLPESSTVIFKVLDQSGAPRPGATVNFTLNTQVGGVALVNTTANSDVNGAVQTIVQSGTVATPVRVTAVVQGISPAISTQSSQLTISTGIPQQASFSLAVACHNVEAWSIDGKQVAVTARLSDRFNNPVPDGTAVSFHTEGGQIDNSCVTQIVSGNSSCAVNWTSQNPRPAQDPALPFCVISGPPAGPWTIPAAGTCDRPGRSSLLAIAIGEESFTDLNGNGTFDPGEPFVDQGERFEDDNENGTYGAGEYFYDFNNDHVRNAPDGFFNGVLCNDPARCNPAAKSTGIGAQNLIILSDGAPAGMLPVPGTQLPNLPAGGTAGYLFLIADLNNNPLPAGTTVSAGLSGATGTTLSAPTIYTIPCATDPTTYAFVVSAGTAAVGATGLLTVTITSPSGLVTVASYPFTVQ